jgi:hypothetical protein
MKSQIFRLDLDTLPILEKARKQQMIENGTTLSLWLGSYLCMADALLSSIIDLLPTDKYTMLFFTTPAGSENSYTYAEASAYDQTESHWELKRDKIIEDPDHPTNNSVPLDAPLFEKYQFLTPGK